MMLNNSLALFMEQGTGKTLPVLFHMSYLFKFGHIENAIVVAPKSALGAWTRDFDKLPPNVRKYIDMEKVTIVNYDLLHRRDYLIEGTYDMIVLDESHMIKNRGSKRSKAIRKMGRKSQYRYILTGTPISNSKLHEFWAQMDFLDPSIFGKWTEFQKMYCVLDQFWQPKWYINQPQLEMIVNAHAYRITKAECLDLPEILEDQIIKVPMVEKRIYKEALENFISDFDIEMDNPLTRLLRLRQISSGFVSDEFGEIEKLKSEKISYMHEILEAREGSKSVIFANFKQSIKDIKESLDGKYNYIVLDGDQPDKQIWKEFQEDKDIDIIVCQYQTANAGIDLFASDSIIFYEPHLSSSVNSQARDRIHRIGQKHTVSYYYLLMEGSIEEKIYKTITDGEDFSKEVLGDYIRLGEL